jgi:hypothetical protein
LSQDHWQGKISRLKLQRRIQSWLAYLRHGDTWRLRRRILQKNALLLME